MSRIQSLIKPIFDHPAYVALRESLSRGCRAASLAGLTRTAKAMVIAGVAHDLGRPLVVLTANNESAEEFRQIISTCLTWLEPAGGSVVAALPAYDCSPYDRRSPHTVKLEKRAL